VHNAIIVVCWLLLPVDDIKVTSVSILTKIVVISNFSPQYFMKTCEMVLELLKDRQTWQNCWACYCSIVTCALKLAANCLNWPSCTAGWVRSRLSVEPV